MESLLIMIYLGMALGKIIRGNYLRRIYTMSIGPGTNCVVEDFKSY